MPDVPHLVLAAEPELVGGTQVRRDAIPVQRHHRVSEVTEGQWPLLFDAPHRLPRAGQELVRNLAVVGVAIGPGRDIFSLGAAGERLPACRGVFDELAQAAVEHGQLTRE